VTGLDSRQVNWWAVLSWAQQQAAVHGVNVVTDTLPLPGTPSWCGLPDGDARKLCAVLLAGAREALAHETRQEHLAEASKAVAASGNWSGVGRPRSPYIAREVA
jgi:hypothetical protein